MQYSGRLYKPSHAYWEFHLTWIPQVLGVKTHFEVYDIYLERFGYYKRDSSLKGVMDFMKTQTARNQDAFLKRIELTEDLSPAVEFAKQLMIIV